MRNADWINMSIDKTDSPNSSDKKIRVAINGIHAKSGGGVTYLRKLLPQLAKQPGLDIHLLLHADQLDLFYPIDDAIHCTVFTFRPSFFSTFVWEQFSLPVIARSMAANVVFSPANYGPIFAKNHIILLRNAVSVIRHINRLRPALYWSMLSIATFISYIISKRAIAVSEYAARILSFHLPAVLKRKLCVVYHGATAIEPADKRSYTERRDLLAVSDIYVQKNYHTLIDAFAQISSQHPDLILNIVGREIDLHYAAHVRQLVKKHGVGDKVRFHGHLETAQITDMYRNCDVFIFPSVVETFGNPLLEAMSAGAPVACSNTAAMPEVIADAGLLFDPYDIDDISAKIDQLLRDSSLRKRLSEKALIRSRQFTWERTAQETADVLRAAVGNQINTPQNLR